MDSLRNLPPELFWSGVIVFVTIGGISAMCLYAIGKGWIVVGFLLLVVIVLALGAVRG